MDKFGNIQVGITPELRGQDTRAAAERCKTARDLDNGLLVDLSRRVESRGNPASTTGDDKCKTD